MGELDGEDVGALAAAVEDQFGRLDVRVNAVSPGWTITDYHLPADDEEAEARIEAVGQGHDLAE